MTDPNAWTYRSRARLIRVVDGDTAVFFVDRKFRDKREEEHVRFLGVNCPEKNKAATKTAGYEAMYFTIMTLAGWNLPELSWPFWLTSPLRKNGQMYDSLGRYLAHVHPAGDFDTDLSQLIIASGNGVPFMVGGA